MTDVQQQLLLSMFVALVGGSFWPYGAIIYLLSMQTGEWQYWWMSILVYVSVNVFYQALKVVRE